MWFTGMPQRCEVIEGGEPTPEGGGVYGRYRTHYRPVEDDFLSALKGYSLLGVKYFIMPRGRELTRAFPLIYSDKDVRIFKNPIALERAWAVRDLWFASSAEEAQAFVFDSGVLSFEERRSRGPI